MLLARENFQKPLSHRCAKEKKLDQFLHMTLFFLDKPIWTADDQKKIGELQKETGMFV